MSIYSLRKFAGVWFAPFLGGVIFLVVFHIAYLGIKPGDYVNRDDGVITLSHARNLVDFGFIGVNPSGERVEGYSAPVQMFVFALVYGVGRIGWPTFTAAQTTFSTFVLGVLFVIPFRRRRLFASAAAAVAAVLLTQLTSFLEWHASGMENAITHVLFAACVVVLCWFAQRRTIDLRLAWIPFLAAISRIESFVHVAPLLLIFAIYWRVFEKNWRGLVLLVLVCALWVGFNLWRLYYFGDLLPNTAYAQGISVGARISALLHFDRGIIVESLRLAKSIFSAHGGYYLLLVAPLIFLIERNRSNLLLLTLSFSMVLTAVVNPFLFGPTRLDVTRSTTQMAMFVCIAIAALIGALRIRRAWLLVAALFPFAVALRMATYVPPYHLCCTTSGFLALRKEMVQFAKSQKIHRLAISNPDLGVVSYEKNFNIVDLGMLGSQMMAKIPNGPLLANYFFEYAAPDMIESHGPWSCRYYKSIFSDARFRERYAVVREEKVRGCKGVDQPFGVWVRIDIVRNSPSVERAFMDALSASLSVDRVAQELQDCQSRSTGRTDCVYVARTVYRFIPELRMAQRMQQVTDLFTASRTRDFDMFLLTGYADGRASRRAIAFIAEESQSRE